MRASTFGRSGTLPWTLCALTLIGPPGAFLPAPAGTRAARHPPRPSPSRSPPSLGMATTTPNDLFGSPGWADIERELDEVPIFAVANEAGQPIKYRIEKMGDAFEVPLFYTHVEDALRE